MTIVAIAAMVFAAKSLAQAPTSLAARPLIVQIHADWCRTCKKLEPTWDRIRDEFAVRSHTLRLDVSDREAYEASAEKARQFDIEDFFHEHRRETGTIAILGCGAHETPILLRGELDLDKYRDAVALVEARC